MMMIIIMMMMMAMMMMAMMMMTMMMMMAMMMLLLMLMIRDIDIDIDIGPHLLDPTQLAPLQTRSEMRWFQMKPVRVGLLGGSNTSKGSLRGLRVALETSRP